MNFFKPKPKIRRFSTKYDFIKEVWSLTTEYRYIGDKRFYKSLSSFADRASIKKEKWEKKLENDSEYQKVLKILNK